MVTRATSIRSLTTWMGPLLAALAILGAPAAALAAPPEDSCAVERGRSFTMDLPDGMRTVGLHRFQFRITFIWPDGTPETLITDNEIVVDPAAPTYRNVLLRLVSNRGLLADGTVESISAIRPDQPAAFYAQFSSVREDGDIIASAIMEITYETSPDVWSSWQTLDRSPMRSVCVEVNGGVLRRANGWAS
jgi:hypothetical protein